MEKVDLIKQFSYRLRDAMIAAGYTSSRSTSGVDIHTLVAMTGYSSQICRKYLSGQVIPDPVKLKELAEKLNVSPGWLLFGDSHSNTESVENKITINKTLLHHIFSHVNQLYQAEELAEEVPNFLTELAQDISQIDMSDEQSKKVIDLALLSAKHFKHE